MPETWCNACGQRITLCPIAYGVDGNGQVVIAASEAWLHCRTSSERCFPTRFSSHASPEIEYTQKVLV